FVAALSFILFGLWTIRGDTLEGENQQRSDYGPFVTVAIAFFIAELGDKTQLATISLAVKYTDPIAVLLGTTTGMVLADGFGIIIGIVLGKRIPDAVIRLVSAGIFIFFGLAGAATVLPAWLPLAGSTAVLFALTVVTLAAAHFLIIQRRRQDAQPQTPRAARGVLDRLSQSLFALLLLIGWVASLGLATPLAAYDHWSTFVLLGGLGWKLIHGAVRPGQMPLRLTSPLIYSILILAALTSTQAFLTGFPLSLRIRA
ncbi:MAG TPA: TMEM165/GDT1 family protein, partial [Candidatus Methylomirabilis sp.]